MRRTTAILSFAAIAAPAAVAHASIDERAFINSFVTVPSSVLTMVGNVLPERSEVGAPYLSEVYDPNLVVSAPAKVSITFIHEGAGYKNSLGYFTYTTDGRTITVLDRQLIFPNASYADPNKGWGGGTLRTGDTVTLRNAAGNERTFQPGTRIGFFLVANGWTGSGVSGWSPTNPALPSASAAKNAQKWTYTTIDGVNPEASTSFPELARHLAQIRVKGVSGFLGGNDFLLLGFEDLRRDRGSDNDFNDLVLVAQSDPPSAILTQVQSPTYDPASNDPDGDGVTGLSDYFPEDPERAFIVRTPPSGWSTIAFEDLYPNVGDADYNDAVVQMAFEEVMRADGTLKDISGTFHLIARGASRDHRFGVALHGLPGDVAGTFSMERFKSTGVHEVPVSTGLDGVLYEDVDGKIAAKIDTVFPSTMRAMVGVDGPFTNTVDPASLTMPASARFVLTFAHTIDRAALGAAPFDPFLEVAHEDYWDIHLPGFSGFPGRSAELPVEEGASSFVDAHGYPFAMMVPQAWRYPLEKVRIDGPQGAYSAFALFRTSRGAQSSSWYTNPWSGQAKRVVDPMSESLRNRPWQLSVTSLRPSM